MRRNYGSGHGYQIDGEPVIGVTTAINKGVPKQLTNWAAKLVAQAAVEQRDVWEALSEYDAIEWLRQRPFERRDTAALRGTQIHRYAQQLIAGQEVDVPEEALGHVDACIAFLRDWDVAVELSEVAVGHTGAATGVPVLYAGTLDLVAVIRGKRWLIDWKTGNAVYGEAALQLAAYRWCDLATVNGEDATVPPVDACAVVHLRADGYGFVPVEADQRAWRAFLHAVGVARFCETSRERVGEEMRPEGKAS